MKPPKNKEDWVFVFPIAYLALTEAVGHEIKVDRTTFIGRNKFKKKCRFLDLPNYGKLVEDLFVKEFFDEISPDAALVVFRQKGEFEAAFTSAQRCISMALDILTLSNLYLVDVRPLQGGRLAEGDNHRLHFLAVDRNSGARSVQSRTGTRRNMVLNEGWHHWQKDFYFDALLQCLRCENGFDAAWREIILKAVTLVSEGLSSRSLPFAFLHNIIALETILIGTNEKKGTSLVSRLEAFLGWSDAWTLNNYPTQIDTVYAKRNSYVHDGDTSKIDQADIDFTDHLLHNVFSNILRHAKLFKNQQALINFSNRVAAERLLGVEPHKSKYLPRTMAITRKGHREKGNNFLVQD
jgi:hypothetical protein